jgi:hypothetical protein
MPVGDVASLSKNLGFLWDDNETARLLSMGARERVEQAFSLQTLGLSFTSSLENEVLSRHQPVRQFVNGRSYTLLKSLSFSQRSRSCCGASFGATRRS